MLHEKQPLFIGCMQNCFISIFPFSYISCVINRHEKQADASILFPCRFCTFLFFSPHRKQLFIEFTTENKKTKLDTSWISCYQLIAPLIYELCSCSKSQGTKIYIYLYSYSQLQYLHILGLQSKWAENEDVSTRNNLSKREVETFPVHSGPFSLNKQPLKPSDSFYRSLKIFLNTQSFVKKKREFS